MDAYASELQARLPEGSVSVARTPQQERQLVETSSVATGLDIPPHLVDSLTELDLFACSFVGTDHLPLDRLDEAGVIVTNASGVNAPGMAEHAIGSILTFARGLHEGWRRAQREEWRHYKVDELADSTVTIVGLGAVGTAVADRLEGFDVDTIGIRYTPSKGGPTDEVVGFDTDAVHHALAQTDYLVLASPLTETTRGLIDSEALATLPPSAVLVNVARGPLVDTDALVHTLQYGGIRGAALDVTDPEPLPPDHPLWRFENVLVTPHNGGSTPKLWSRLSELVAKNVRRLETGGELENVVLDPR